MKRIAVIGAGPVGLQAALLWARLPDTHVTIYEKRAYPCSRQRTVFIDPAYLRHCCVGPINKVRICDLQLLTRAQLQQLPNVTWATPAAQEVVSLDALDGHYDLFIVATGSKSPLRDAIVGPVVSFREAMRIVTASYAYGGTDRPSTLNPFALGRLALSLEGVVIEKVLSRSVVQLFWIPPDDLPEAEVTAGVRTWASARPDLAALPDPSTATISLSSYGSTLYAAPRFTARTPAFNTPVYIAGDAALGLPYFRSLQVGLENLAWITVADPSVYEAKMQASRRAEVLRASSFDMGLGSVGIGLAVGNRLPWNPLRWSKDELRGRRAFPVTISINS